ncbi:MAG TPA: KilA-N domain-containing protein [Acidobacteriota bacterium]|nr:KilA-N domain-containing protein [Acidobacteriota bacterium]
MGAGKSIEKIKVLDTVVSYYTKEAEDYISLTDIARHKNPEHMDDIIKNWLRNRNTIEFLGIWEQLYNPDFKPVEFDGFRRRSGLNSFVLTPKQWIDGTGAVGIISKSGRYGGTFAHRDIAFEFASWISVEFRLYLVKEFQRLKSDENSRLKLEWSLQRMLAKINYSIHTDAIKESLIPPLLSKKQTSIIYASEADMLNVAIFGKTAKEWRNENPGQEGNIRDHAMLEQLVVITNLECINAVLIRQGLPQNERIVKLNEIAITQMKSLLGSPAMKKLGPGSKGGKNGK